MHFLKAFFKSNTEINVLRLWLREYLKYLAPNFHSLGCYMN